MAATANLFRTIGRAPIALIAVAVGLVSLLVAAQHAEPPTTYAAASNLAHTADLAAGLAALVSGAIASTARPRGAVGPLLVAIGAAWFAADWVGWSGGWASVRSIAMVAVPFAVPLVAHLAVAYPTGRLRSRAARAYVVAAYALTLAAAVGRALYRDPFRDLHCWNNCRDNVFLLRSDRRLASWFEAFGLRSAAAIGLLAAAVASWRLARMSNVARRAGWFVLMPVAFAALAQATHAAILLGVPAEDPRRSVFEFAFLARAAAIAAVGLGVIWGVVRAERTARAVTRLADALGTTPAPGTLQTTLSGSLGDHDLVVAYWLPDAGRYVDATGAAVEPRARHGQAMTSIVRGRQPLAVVVHDEGLASDRDLGAEIGAAARLAVDNERLRAEVLARLDELCASRARIVATADAARRRLERDLHDGAQQGLLAVLFELRLAAATADGDAAARIAAATETVQETLSDLRDVAHGIYPAILAEAGLGPALATFADRSPLPLELAIEQGERSSADAEAAAYLVVAETVGDAVSNGATGVDGRVEIVDGSILLDLRHDGAPISPDVVVHLGDRVGALGGELRAAGMNVRAVIPCAS